jgi:hypothetical protein
MTHMYRGCVIIVAVAAVLEGCSTAPRDFTPTLKAVPSERAAFEADLAGCKAQVASGRRSNFSTSGRTTSVAAGGAVGVGAGLATGASAASGAGMLGGAAGAAGLAAGFVVAAPIAIVVISRNIRARKEREIKAATATCLQENGYQVADWERTPKSPAAAR